VKSITMESLTRSYRPRSLKQERRAMAGTQWSSKRRALVISAFLLAFAALLWVAAPQMVPTAELLGSDWQCTKTAFVLTTCTMLLQPSTGTAQNPRHDEVAARTVAP
jgi:hypothetical protein